MGGTLAQAGSASGMRRVSVALPERGQTVHTDGLLMALMAEIIAFGYVLPFACFQDSTSYVLYC